ncbi:MAG: hypothetical protein LPK45_09915 [Bacteroidota bacterium]|nr:hypothetical protein [Bacteroidota bacterium]MDX5431408.1 hypothetical protein [Bacteroidota bacterium]MDX5470136.1 hypothetical protein [Bacteroidota bacterium]
MKKLVLLSILLASLVACYKEVPDSSPNPFVNQNQGTGENEVDSLNPASFEGLHKQIFSVKCAVPLCHDGSFEPDFRTMESAYNNLVYHPVVKNNAANAFAYRAIPYNPEASWLMERVTTDDAVLGRMPLYSNPLNEKELQHLRDWINAGCPDWNGNVAVYPNLQPQVLARFALNQNNKRIDTAFNGPFPAPFIVATGSSFTLGVQVKDDSTATSALKNLQFKFSYDKDDFTNAQVVNGNFFVQDFIVAQVNTAMFNPNQTVYFRFYCNDAHHTTPAEFPRNNSPFYYKEYFAFIIK